MQVEVTEGRSFKSVISHRASANDAQKHQAVLTYHKNLLESDDTFVKTEEEIRVIVSDDKVVVAKGKPAEQRQPGSQQAQPEVTQHAVAGKYTEIMSMLPADAAEFIGSTYVLPLYS